MTSTPCAAPVIANCSSTGSHGRGWEPGAGQATGFAFPVLHLAIRKPIMKKQYTVAELERVLQSRRLKLQKLLQRRDRLRQELSRLEEQIIEISGIAKTRRTRRRPKNTKTLLTAVQETLAEHIKGLSLRELSDKVLSSGYKTSSTNFSNTLYQTLYHNSDTIVHDANAHLYRLKRRTSA
jgi:hypothetical protein